MHGLKYLRLMFVAVAVTVVSSPAIVTGQTSEPKSNRTGSISGHVIVGGKAAAGMPVGAFGSDNNFNRRIPAAQTTTDNEGSYHLTGLAAGNYQITTFTTNLTPEDPTSDFQFGFAYFASTKSVMLAAGEEVRDIDIKLVRGGVITGRVTDAENNPIVEERVNLSSIREDRGLARLPIPIGQMYTTDDRGAYRIYGLPAGRYRVSVGSDVSRGYIGTVNGYFQLTYHPDATDATRATIIDLAEGGEAANVDIRVGRYEETYSIAGRVVDSETGVPISGARIGLMISRGGQATNLATFANPTEAGGKFSQQGLTPGRYSVYVAADFGDTEFYSDPVFFDVVDKNVSGLEIKALRGLSVSGTLVAENSQLKDLLQQLPGLEVSATTGPADGRMSPSTLRSSGRGRVGPDGSFQISGLRPGRVSFTVYAPNSARRASVLRISHGGIGVSQIFELQPGQSVSSLQIVVEYGTGAISGNVKFEGGMPTDVQRTEVICYRQGQRSFAGGATLDARGHFLMKGFAPGTYECGLQHIYKPGSQRRMPTTPRQTATVVNDAEAELNFVVNLTGPGGGP